MNRDFKEILSELSGAGVEFLLVGAHALAAHGLPRATGDIDIWVRCSPENSVRILGALDRFGAPMAGISSADFETPGVVFQIGVPPHRIDILTEIDGVSFDEAWEARVQKEVGGVPLSVLSRVDLLRNKRATGRPKDAADAAWLEAFPGPGPD